MTALRRRRFLKIAASAAGALWRPGRAPAYPLGLPLGLQPYTVRNDLKADFTGTLRKIVAMGYREIELSGGLAYGVFYGQKPPELHKILDGTGLHAPSYGVRIALEMHPGFVVYSPETLLRPMPGYQETR